MYNTEMVGKGRFSPQLKYKCVEGTTAESVINEITCLLSKCLKSGKRLAQLLASTKALLNPNSSPDCFCSLIISCGNIAITALKQKFRSDQMELERCITICFDIFFFKNQQPVGGNPTNLSLWLAPLCRENLRFGS